MGTFTDPDDKRFQFRMERDEEGNYYIRSLMTRKVAGLWSSYLDLDGDHGTVTFRIVFDEEAGGFILEGSNGSLSCQTQEGGYAQYRTKATPWKFRVGGVEEWTGIESPTIHGADAGILYDLTGRRVDSPAQGIYIRDGRKVLIR